MDISVIIAIVSFFVIFILYYIYCLYKKNMINKKKKRKKEITIMEISYLKYRFGLDENKLLNNNKILIFISLINAFIITFVFYIISLINLKVVWQLLIGFVLLMGLIYAIYELLGRYLKGKGY